ncbi:16S rRNA (cytosine(1407)-C(5))-methyltransferase RsmF [Pseudoalteromonas sp. S16_S37]|uniref:16S rRNA (cytosine(1407)-C(5))-methyltransferase RsmF n=1 Tax=Pseudoalteromonas sp. S16_S37 TaxID=2720228 RepID=UPI00168024E2|nr:16S rRNA (cytosine(1407)-C(5))-methyltransferase RsmF [Pseudoalteromonas sp. S16_S37]MBD1582750.1 16S rRNA (cytosine(1407)-C(5))-methyltransferase RsmF [Pseudoalteromonas sp. S16_S37]
MTPSTYIPESFIDDVKTYIPRHLSIDEFVEACQRPLRRSVRVNTLKMSVTDFQSYCKAHNWEIDPVPWCNTGFWLTRPDDEEQNLPIGNTELHLSGCIYVQEASSMLPVQALSDVIDDCEYVLDMAAAPGSKTTQLAAMMNGNGVLVANEFSSSRVKVLAANTKRMGVANCALSHFNGNIFGNYMFECFDSILLDAPCSGEGTVRKDADALKNWSIESNIEIAEIQKQLIKSAFYALKPSGTLVYSTCTLTPLENQEVCQYLLEQFAGHVEVESLTNLFPNASQAITEQGFLHVWPQIYDSEGFFIARFKKLSSVPNSEQQIKKGAFPFAPTANKLQNDFNAYIKKHFGIKAIKGQLMTRDKELWLFPEGMEQIANKIKYSRLGILLGTTHKNGVRLEHEFATALGKLASENSYAMTPQQAQDYFQGKDIRLAKPTTNVGEVILTLCGAPVGLGKWQKNKIKNSLPRDLVSDTQLITWV